MLKNNLTYQIFPLPLHHQTETKTQTLEIMKAFQIISMLVMLVAFVTMIFAPSFLVVLVGMKALVNVCLILVVASSTLASMKCLKMI
jgi:hypothetical protein